MNNQLLDQRDAVFVVPSRPAAKRKRYRRTCTLKAISYGMMAFSLLCLLVDLAFGLPWDKSAGLYIIFASMCIFAIKAVLAIHENRLEEAILSPHPQRLTRWWMTLDLLLPWWMNSLEVIVYPPSQADQLSLAEEQESPQRASQAAMSEKIVVEAATAIVRIGISLLGRLTIALYGANGKKVVIAFRNRQSGQSRYAALIAYLAVIGECSWVSRLNILRTIYRAVANKASSFDTDRLRIQELIDAVARSNGLIPVKLFENGRDKLNESAWRLSSLCVVEIAAYDVLHYWYSKIVAAQANKMDIELEELRRVYKHIIQICDAGYLTQHLYEHEIWNWARDKFFEFRTMYLTILEYAAEREIKAGQQQPGIQIECLRRAAELYKLCALMAVKAIADMQRGERNLRRCQDIYQNQLHDSRAVKNVQKAYDKEVNRNKTRSLESEDS